MNIPSKYDPAKTEQKWYDYWQKNGFFHSEPDEREPYTIVIPPPNVTGVLHMGHMLNNTIQDILIRRQRMKGKNACWVPGTDHASIATEARVVAKLREEGIKKSDLSREEFLKHAWEWRQKHGDIILEQLKKLGASCDWKRTKFTMDDEMSESVIKVFVDLYNKGKIYRGLRMVHWDPAAQTALSDEEVFYRDVSSKLYYVRYQVEGEDSFVTIATTRPETILGDTAVCVNPKDKRYQHLKGKKVVIPLVNRVVPVIEDDYVDMEFGTGCLKITPAHDANDYDIGQRHDLEIIDLFNDDGTLSRDAEVYIGMDRFEAREAVAKKLDEEGHLVKTEDYDNSIGYSERTDVPIEPKLSKQWFLDMKQLAKPALDNVMNDNIQLRPPKFKNTYRHWMENVKDWCISRQLWWGQRIPAYYLPDDDDCVVAETPDEALKQAREKTGDNALQLSDLKQDEDVLDTWFSSWLWPISVFDGVRNPDNTDMKYYYPTNDLVTAPEILFFWVARMIIAGYEYQSEKPFENVYLTGIVRDNQRRKMSKSLGNSPDPLELMKNYGADGVRIGMMLCSPAGNDLLFDESLPEQGRNFVNKIWNAFRLVKSWNVDTNISQPETAKLAVQWFEAKINQTISQVEGHFGNFRISDALMALYRLFWDDFASWYLELVKPSYQQPIDEETYKQTLDFFNRLLKLLHPFIPFVTEEIWQYLENREAGESLMITDMPEAMAFDENDIREFELIKEVVRSVRNVRSNNQIPNKETLDLFINGNEWDIANQYAVVIKKLSNVDKIELTDQKLNNAASFMIKATEFYIPIENVVDQEEELGRLKEELDYTRGFLNSVMKKLSNDRFVQNAPEQVIEKERRKREDAEAKIKVLEQRIDEINT